DPYTLVVFKKGLYLVGFSHYHKSIRTLSLDQLVETAWLAGRRFTYPENFDPSQLLSGSFGLIAGPETEVSVFFTQRVAHLIRRRKWHPSQQMTSVDGGIELTMKLRGTKEFLSWVLEWGDQAELLSPASLRDALSAEIRRMAALYQRAPRPLQASLPIAE